MVRVFQSILAGVVVTWLAAQPALAAAPEVGADSRETVLTNLNQLVSGAEALSVTARSLQLDGIVTWRSVEDDAFVLQDETGAMRFQLQLPGGLPAIKQSIRLEGKVWLGNGCAVLRQSLQVDNDGLHGMVEHSGRHTFPAGRQPFQLDYFQAASGMELAVFWQGPGIRRALIPAEALFHEEGTNPIPGVRVDYYEGRWPQLPDFKQLTPSHSFIATNLEIIEPNSETNFGLSFKGSVKIPVAGEYEFFLTSDDGSRLTFLERSWNWASLEPRPMPSSNMLMPGQLLDANEDYQWSEVCGEAAFAGAWGDKCAFNLASDAGQMRVEVGSGGRDLAALLPHSQVRVRGVAAGSRKSSGPLLATDLLVATADDVVIESLSAEQWRRWKTNSIVEAAKISGDAKPFRLRGVACAVEAGRHVTLGDGTNGVKLLTSQASSNWTGVPMEALVFVRQEGGKIVLEAKVVRLHQTASNGKAASMTIEALRNLRPDELQPEPLVRIRGVVTSARDPFSITVHDGDYGISCWFDKPVVTPAIGNFVEVEGHVRAGAFGPNLGNCRVSNLGRAPLPTPLTPTWEQLINGSLDHQWVEVQGVVQHVNLRTLAVGVVGGRLEAELTQGEPLELAALQDAIVRIRGTLVPIYNEQKQVEGVNLRVNSPLDVEMMTPPISDPFAVPQKTIEELSRFDPSGVNPFHRVRVQGQVIYADAAEFHLVAGDKGLRCFLKSATKLTPGDWVDVVGYPKLGRPVPQLDEAVTRVIRRGDLPEAIAVTPEQFFSGKFESRRVALDAVLSSIAQGQREKTLELQFGGRFLTARVHGGTQLPFDVPVGSRVHLTGTCAGRGLAGDNSYELLVNRVTDVVVLALAPWWTVKRILILAGILAAVLLGAFAWIFLLHRKVEQRTAALNHEMRQRKEAELQRASELERSRIARDLHDDLGASLTEMSLLAGLGQNQTDAGAARERFDEIGGKARSLVNSLDVIVWAADPEEDDIETFADYVSGFARVFLESSGIVCRFKIPIEFPSVKMDGRVRHDLFLAMKETLNNIARHSGAAEVEFALNLAGERLEINITDNGSGFDAATIARGNGLTNLQQRLTGIGGMCVIESSPGHGTKVHITLDLNATK